MTTPTSEFYAMPSTRGQERFWSLDQLRPGNPALNMPLMWKCIGPLDLDLLSEAFRQVVERHEALRTTFDLVNGQVKQIIGPSWIVPIPVVNLESIADAETSERAKHLTNEHAALRMNLRSGPLLAVKLLRFAPTSHMLLVTLHHIICDGVSTGVLLRDVATIYQALLEGKQARLPELPIQLADFAIWEQEWRDTPSYAASLTFWRGALGTDFSRIELRHDAAIEQETRRGDKEVAGEIETLLLDQRSSEEVHEFCTRNFITHNVFFSSIFSLLLNRISRQQDLLIGSPSANRVLQTEDLVGMFMNIQAMRVKIEDKDTFNTLINKVQQWTIRAYDHQQLPFEDLIYDSQFSTKNGSFELPVFFLYQKSFMVTHRIGQLTIIPLRSMSPGAAFEIMFAVVDRAGEGPRLQLEYNPLKFKRETIQRYLKLYLALLKSALEDPSALLTRVGGDSADLLTAAIGQPEGSEDSLSGALISPSAIADAADKLTRKQLAAEQQAFRDSIEFQLVEMWQATLGIPSISLDDGFFSLGVSSLSALRLITKINRVYSTDLGLASLFSAPTIRAIAVLIRERLSPNMHSSLVPIQPAGTKPPLFVVHGILGNVLCFYGLVTHLGKDQPVYGIQAQALVSGEPALLRLQDMARYYIAEMRKVQPQGPYNLLGYSFGGTVAMEMAHQLQAVGQEVGLLGMLDSKAPAYLKAFLKSRPAVSKDKSSERLAAADVVRISRTEKLEQIAEKVRTRLIRISCQIATMLKMETIPAFMKSAWSINFVANSKYKPRVFDGRMTLIRAARQPDPEAPAELGWDGMFTGGVEVKELPGTHETLWSEQNVEDFATILAERLQSVEVGELQKAG